MATRLKLFGIVILIVVAALLWGAHLRSKQRLLRRVAAEHNELQRAKVQLQEAQGLLAAAENKLGFLSRAQSRVQATAYTGQGRFANGEDTESAYAVPHHQLPQDAVLSVALSPSARRILNAQLNDFIVLLEGRRKLLARFVDMTSSEETRAVVDIFFASAEEARIFGRRHFYAVNISSPGSPFRME